MGSLQDKLTYLAETKNMIKNAISNKGVSISDTTPFRSFASLIDSITTGGGSGGYELFKVEKVTKESGATTINITGFKYFGDPDIPEEMEDFSHYNGNYVQTEDTLDKEGYDRLFKHESEDLWLKGHRDADGEFGENTWYIVSDLEWGVWEANLFIYSGEFSNDGELPNGTYYFHSGQWDDDFQCTVTLKEGSSSPALIEGKKVSEIISGSIFVVEGDLITLDYDYEPKLKNVYPVQSSKIISKNGIEDYSYGYPIDDSTIAFFDFESQTISDGKITVNGTGADNFSPIVSGTISNGSTLENGYIGKGWNLNGDYLQTWADSNRNKFKLSGDFTIEAMLYPNSTDRQCFFSYKNDGKFGVCFSYSGDCKFSVFGTEEEGWSSYDCSDQLGLNQWYHVAVQRKNGKLQFFINFVKTKEADISNINFAEDQEDLNIPYFGRWGGDHSDFGARWKGYIDQIRISNIARY